MTNRLLNICWWWLEIEKGAKHILAAKGELDTAGAPVIV